MATSSSSRIAVAAAVTSHASAEFGERLSETEAEAMRDRKEAVPSKTEEMSCGDNLDCNF